MPAKTVFSMDTEYTADSVECCPFDGYTSLTVVATYQMVDGKTQTRTGRIYLFETQTTASDTEFGVDIVTKEVARCECDAVLDSRWIMLSGEPFVLTVSSTGTLCVYNGIPEKKLNRCIIFYPFFFFSFLSFSFFLPSFFLYMYTDLKIH